MKSVERILFEAFKALPEGKQIQGLEFLISDPGARNVLACALREMLVEKVRPADSPEFEVPVTFPAVVDEKGKPAPVPAPAKIVAPIPGPPRVISVELEEKGEKTFNPEDGYKKWVGFLEAIVGEGNIWWPTLQSLTVELVQSGWQFSVQDFVLLFEAARKADQARQYIVSDGASAIYKQAPPEMLAFYLFEKDGKLAQIMGQLDDCEVGQVRRSLVANIFVVASAVEALGNNGLEEVQAKRVKELTHKVNSLDGPKKLIDRLSGLVVRRYSDEKPAPPATATLAERLGPDAFKKLSVVVASGSVN